jgi:uncharacterized SAM-binding protein YcdF (DUF218 family)
MLKKFLLFSISVLVFFLIFGMIFLFSLDVSQSTAKEQVDKIVVLGGGLGSRIKKAWELQTHGLSKSDEILITGIPLDPEKVVAEHPFLKYLKDHPKIKYEFVSISKTKNTWEEASYIKQYMLTHNKKRVIIVTHPLHSGRVKMALDKVAHFKEAGLSYTIVGDRELDFWDNFWKDKELRSYALREVVKRMGYEVKAVFH